VVVDDARTMTLGTGDDVAVPIFDSAPAMALRTDFHDALFRSEWTIGFLRHQRHIARRRDFSYADWQRQRTAVEALLAARARGVSLLRERSDAKEDAEDQEANAARSEARAQEGSEPAPGEVAPASLSGPISAPATFCEAHAS
jgi:hypothetical protein